MEMKYTGWCYSVIMMFIKDIKDVC